MECCIFTQDAGNPFTIDGATVRWSRPQEFGLAFTKVRPGVQRQISTTMSNTDTARGRRVRPCAAFGLEMVSGCCVMGSHSPDTLAVSPQGEKQIIDQEKLIEKLKEALRNRRKNNEHSSGK